MAKVAMSTMHAGGTAKAQQTEKSSSTQNILPAMCIFSR